MTAEISESPQDDSFGYSVKITIFFAGSIQNYANQFLKNYFLTIAGKSKSRQDDSFDYNVKITIFRVD